MLAPKLLELAQLVGLSHYSIARQLKVDRSLVSHWARGRISVPAKHQDTLKDLVSTAVQDYWIRAEDITIEEVRSEVPPHGSLRQRVADLAWDCLAEDSEDRGCGPTAFIPALIEVMTRYMHMSQTELRDPQNAAAIDALADRLKHWTTSLRRLGPLMFVPSEEETVRDNRQRKCRLPAATVCGDSSPQRTPDPGLAPPQRRRVS